MLLRINLEKLSDSTYYVAFKINGVTSACCKLLGSREDDTWKKLSAKNFKENFEVEFVTEIKELVMVLAGELALKMGKSVFTFQVVSALLAREK